MNSDRKKRCDICGAHEDDDFQLHKDTLKHRFNYCLYEYTYRYKKCIQLDGITIEEQLAPNNKEDIFFQRDKDHGKCIVKLKPKKLRELRNEISCIFKLTNNSDKTVWIIGNILHPYEAFRLKSERNIYLLKKGETCSYEITLKLNTTICSSFKIPLSFQIQPDDRKDDYDYKTIYRSANIYISENEDEKSEYVGSPFRGDKFLSKKVIPPATQLRKFLEFMIPDNFVAAFGREPGSLSFAAYQDYLRYMGYIKLGITRENYLNYFQTLLWLDEMGAIVGLANYNMTNVPIEYCRGHLVLEVPGLAEKRPSVIVGDMVEIFVPESELSYQGYISNVTDDTVFIKDVNTGFVESVEMFHRIVVNVSFHLTRLQYEREHVSIDIICKNYLRNSLFPLPPLVRNVKIIRLNYNDMVNKDIHRNEEQRTAVESIVSGSSFAAPYIIYGPPGTGKSVTLIEAVLQIRKRYPNKVILICAPSNATCDMLASKLVKAQCNRTELLRLHSGTRNPADIPEEILDHGNFRNGEYARLRAPDFVGKKIIISTLVLIGKHRGDIRPDCLFIDEAAQASEPECSIPISLLRPNSLIVLAGDPKQLGPVTASQKAISLGLGVSLLERLMNTNDLYQPINKKPLTYDQRFITMLVQNYRSHQDIVAIPNELFYGKSLQCRPNPDLLCSTFISPMVQEKNYQLMIEAASGHSVEFCGVLSKEQRKGTSPSYFNQMEIEMVFKYIDVLLAEAMDCLNVCPKEIGVIAPYIRQVQQIKARIESNNKYKGVEVGTTESFQGQEKRIIIISTVRAQHNLLGYDRKYNLGFVSNERRFNVALTRAQSKLIIIGNPFVLLYDKKCWLKYIEFCEDLDGYFGIKYIERDENVMDHILKCFNTH